jgi:hypothetical protein
MACTAERKASGTFPCNRCTGLMLTRAWGSIFREKWTLFDESTRVPLIIHHPQSPFKGMHYSKPVEHIDVFPTVHDLIGAPFSRVKKIVRRGEPSIPLSGQSLAPVVLGTGGSHTHNRQRQGKDGGSISSTGSGIAMPTLNKTFAISQILRCMPVDRLVSPSEAQFTYDHPPGGYNGLERVVPRVSNLFFDCETGNTTRSDQLPFMGYSMRTSRFRYTCHVLMNRTTWEPMWELTLRDGPYVEELYDHRNEKLSDFTHMETVNLAPSASYRDTLLRLRKTLFSYLRNEVIYSRYGSW